MGGMTDLMLKDWEKREATVQVALRVGLLKQCRFHEEVLDPLNCNFEDAYRLGNFLISHNDDVVAVFDGNRRELTDYLKDITNHFGTECPSCSHW
jgi:hypothetical protein